MASRLPQTVDFDAEGISVWDLLLSAEEAAKKETTTTPKYKDNLVGVRVLGFFLKDFWEHSSSHYFGLIPYKHLLLEVKSCYAVSGTGDAVLEAQHDKVFQLGLSYRNHLMRLFRSDSEPLPVAMVSSHACRPSFYNAKIETIKCMEKAEMTNSDVKCWALLRDGYKCLVSGGYDLNSCIEYSELTDKARAKGIPVIGTECAYLFSESAQGSNKSSEYTATAFTMLQMFGIEQEVQKILGGKVNRLSNVLTMRHELHQASDRFSLWLEEVPGTPNTYDVVLPETGGALHLIVPPPAKRVTFRVDSAAVAACKEQGAELPELPSQDLIAIRSACARVAHISGAAEQIDQIRRDEDDILVMTGDGSTADLLTSLINERLISFGA